MKSQELVALVKSGEVTLVQIGENKFQILRGDATELVSFMTARGAVKELSGLFIHQGEFGMWKTDTRDAEERRIADEKAKVEADPVSEKSLDDLDDEAFAQAVIAGSGRKAKTGTPAAKKSAKTDPGMYIGERRNPKSGVSKAMWDLFDALLQDTPDLVLNRELMVQICLAQNWTVSTMYCQYRWWRLARGLEVRTRAPAGSRTMKTDEEIAEEKEAVMIDEVASMDEIEVTKV